MLIEAQPGFVIVAETSWLCVLGILTAALRPRLLLLDWELPGVDDGAAVGPLLRTCGSSR